MTDTPIKRGTARRMGLAHPDDYVSVHVLPDLARLGQSLRAAMARAGTQPPPIEGGRGPHDRPRADQGHPLVTVCPERFSRPGHDRDVLNAMWSQVQLGRPLSKIQVEHLLQIVWRAGATAEHDLMYEGVTEGCRPLFDYARVLAQTGSSGDRFVWCVARVYGPTLRWRDRLRLAVYLAFRKGYSR